MPIKPTFFSKKLITWYLQNGRSLPWRETTDPYHIWLSEIMLQQTRVEQGLPYYLKFIKAFPTIEDLATAPEEKVLKLWQGLGYYSRARNLHFTAKLIAFEMNGIFPDNFKDLLKLKGVGDYTASAIASICFDESAAVVDGNVYRVLSRVFGIDTPTNTTNGIKQFKQLAQELIDSSQPGTFNQAVMEFGARHCTPQKPGCNTCIFSDKCEALRQNTVSVLPVKLKKTKVKDVYFNYIVPISGDEKTILEQRTGKGIWQNLFQFPLVETKSNVDLKELMLTEDFTDLAKNLSIDSVVRYNDTPIIHKLSHRNIHTQFWIANISELNSKGILKTEVKDYAVPVLIENFVSEFSFFQD